MIGETYIVEAKYGYTSISLRTYYFNIIELCKSCVFSNWTQQEAEIYLKLKTFIKDEVLKF